jgi:CheY-like chemotaxis protein/HPt (histidine-containing phosphotransfer) domain-containing protein
MVSHEIRTPMNGVIGLADVLLATPLTETQRRYAEGIQTAGGALLTVINDLLDFSRAEAGKIAVDEQPFDLRELVEDVVEILAGRARDKGIELVGYVPPDVPVALVGDAGRLRQVLLNLCGNAVKFTGEGEVTVTARWAPTDVEAPDRITLRIQVDDTGIGISPTDQARMFDAFAQADASTMRRYGGTGLGLAISRRLIQAMGGQIGVDSEVGQGSTFWFELPLRHQLGVALHPPRPADLQGLRVLVVDDNATSRQVLTTQLTDWGLIPTAVGSGEEALATLRELGRRGRPFDVAILDSGMPTMNGLALARQVSADHAIPAVHMILLTSGPTIGPDEARSAGISAWLTKPVHRSRLFDSLARMASHARPAREERRPEPSPAAPEEIHGHVLLAEDNEINQLVALGILNTIGYQADVANDGAAALELAAEHDYDAILMDCQMPELDGYLATQRLRDRERAEHRDEHIPVIALTAGARDEDRDRCLAAGMDDFVSKPFSRETLSAALARWVHADPPGGAEPVPPAPDSAVAGAIAERLDEIRGPDGDGDSLVRTLIASYLNRTPDDLDELDRAVSHHDYAEVELKAHRMRGGSANIGANRMAERLSEVESTGRAGKEGNEPAAEGESEALRRLRDEFAEVRTVLSRTLDTD